MDLAEIFKYVGKLIKEYLSLSFVFAGHKFTVASIIIWTLCAILVVSFIRGMTN